MIRRYRRSRHVLSYWADERAIVYNYATAVQAEATPLIWQVLDFCDDWRSARDLSRAAPALGLRLSRGLLESLRGAGFVEASDVRRDRREERMDAWRAWNPSAGFFHTQSRQVTYGDPAVFASRLAEKAAGASMPASVRPPARKTVPLSTNGRSSSAFARVLADRRTWRQFSSRPVEHAAFGEILRLTSGITHWLTVPGLGDVPLTTSPSGGARHPLETYVIAWNVRGIRSGVYRYAADRHEIDVIRKGATDREIRRLIPRQPWFSEAGFVVIFAAVFARTQWRYEYARAYRAVLIEAGHRCQTLLLAATALGLAPFSTMAVDDARLEKLLGIDGIDEAVLYAAGVGTRPAYSGRVVMPSHVAAPVFRRHALRQARRARRESGAA